ncbi:chemotaxis protein CheW [Nitrincola tapanii]|uniref:Chemotaxis protein CheA n=1 Tax=Nitrincola tapanii TaxID=1708751 RepID=A0A5A9W646_9GAMM|nr:chemotaxis protein CheW [Nitrincola tapanii]KAA0875665.1 chemotaxis protein CheA [Nitrincola tapanii]
MSIDLSQFHQVFIDEAYEHLATMESLLLSLDLDAPDLEELNAIFRAAHSIKGGSGTFGFKDIADLTHALETLLDKLRRQELQVTDEMITAFLHCCDLLSLMLEAHQDGTHVDDQAVLESKAHLMRLAEGSESVLPVTVMPGAPESTFTSSPHLSANRWRIHLHPHTDLFSGAVSEAALLSDLAAMGDLVLISRAANSQRVWELTTALNLEALEEVFAFVCQADEVSFEALNETPQAVTDEDEEDAYGFFVDEDSLPAAQTIQEEALREEAISDEDPGFGFFVDLESLPAHSEPEAAEEEGFGFFVDPSELPAAQDAASQAALEAEQGFGFFVDESELPVHSSDTAEMLGRAAIATKNPVPVAPSQPDLKTPAPAKNTEKASGVKSASKAAAAETSIRVGIEKVDQLINLVGELVITRSMLAQSASILDPVTYEAIHNGLANLERNSRDLQEAVMSIRMLPINFVFGRFPRVVRDLSQKMQKKVALKLVGEETELDKGLIEKLADPLTHLLRNSIDHGIESPEIRSQLGKPEEGTITLSASHQGGSILVEISDDGAGLNRERLLEKAREKGLPISDNPTDKEVWQLIFAPGFSTAKEITDVSGRGVGMDVVQRNIAEMKGQVEIDSVPGMGTRIGLRLPLTLAILDGMSLRVGEEIFILPLTRIIESIQPESEQLKSVSGQGRVVHIRGEYVPLLELWKLFTLTPKFTDPEAGILVVVETVAGKMALFVDELIAQQQVVIKSLETHYRKVEGISGATIMGDGRVALIIDIDRLARMHKSDVAPESMSF